MPALVINSEAPIEVPMGETLLAACASRGLFLPSACGGRGMCGRCATQILKGNLSEITPAELKKLTDEERAQGRRLACQCKIQGDMTVSLHPDILGARRHSGTLVSKTQLTHDVVLLRIAVAAPPPMAFRAGQYIHLECAVSPPPTPALLRSFSLALSPAELPHIELMVRQMPNGCGTTWIHQQLTVGMNVAFRGPFGSFQLSETDAPIIAIAGSSGMAPLRAIFHDMLQRGIHRPAQFFFGARTQQDLFLLDEWAAFAQKAPWFSFIPVLSDEPAESPWTGERGLVTDAVRRHTPNLAQSEAFLCGSPGMINAAITVLVENGMSLENIFYDKFA